MLTLTSEAITEINRIISEKNLPPGTGLRVSIKGGGCAGFTYVMDFVTDQMKLNPFDVEFESQGMKVVVDKKSLLYIAGTKIDFDRSLTERGFKFINPKADAACGCGTSFTPKIKPLV